MLNNFQFSRVWENILVYANKPFWIAQPYFLTNIKNKVSASFFFLLLRLLTVIIFLSLKTEIKLFTQLFLNIVE